MLLILAGEEDSLAHAVYRLARQSGADVHLCSDAQISETNDDPSAAELLCGERRVRAAELTGVLFRLPACWWRTSAQADDHDLIAAWYTLLWNLPCSVVNRFGLSWWFDPGGYAVQLSLHLNASVLPALAANSLPTGATLYMAGARLVAREPGPDAAVDPLNQFVAKLTTWQQETGVYLGRLSLRGQRTSLVDPSPDFSAESAEVISNVAAAVFTTLTRTA